MKPEAIDWDEDLPPAEPEEEYRDLVRTIKRTKGFSLLFVECSPAEGERWIARVKTDIPQQKIEVLRLKESVYDFYNLIEELPNRDRINVLFVQGLEYSLYEYEQEKKELGWESKDIYSYSWRGVPPVLINLNQQRERFRDNFKICFVFLLPKFAIDYFIQRAPDFFDWRSSLFKLSMDKELLQLESMQACSERMNREDYLALNSQEKKWELVRIQALIDEDGQTSKQKAELFFEQGLLHNSAEEYAKAIASYDKALEIKPDSQAAWNNRGNALYRLGRLEEAIASYDKALETKPDAHEAWYNRGITLGNLGRLEEAIASYDKALEFQHDYHDAWYNRGIALGNLGRLEEAIASYDKALELKPDAHEAWNNRGIALGNLRRLEEAIAYFDKALEFKPDYHEAWYNRGITLGNLGRWEEALASYEKALEIKPDLHAAWYNRGLALDNLGRWEEALASSEKALEIKPDLHAAWNNRGNALGNLGLFEEALASYDKALEIQPDYHESWYNRGLALANLGRWEEALASYDKALEFKPDNDATYYNKAWCYALHSQIDQAIQNLQQAINLNPDKYREMAKTDSDFDSIRSHNRFQALIQE
ncbi:tetratricopeptide repeat protein [Microcoleus sp. MON2_D5]|uniref:tetratricopeptide repeat protein n=1 Tax=Microcoleus sp. MON2_D5 TaxID=2818833 RepID=UPI002FCE9A5C